MAKFGVVVSEWMTRLDLDASAVQCWSSLQQNYGVQRLHEHEHDEPGGDSRACEVDVMGTVCRCTRFSSLRNGPSALVDWNNNYGDDPDDKCVFFHCGNWAKTYFHDIQD